MVDPQTKRQRSPREPRSRFHGSATYETIQTPASIATSAPPWRQPEASTAGSCRMMTQSSLGLCPPFSHTVTSSTASSWRTPNPEPLTSVASSNPGEFHYRPIVSILLQSLIDCLRISLHTYHLLDS